MDYQKTENFKKDTLYFQGGREDMLAFVPPNSQKILDVGCGEGVFMGQLKNINESLEIWGIEPAEEAGKKAEANAHKVLLGSIEDNIEQLPDNYFDAIFFNDVIEHLIDPYEVLSKMKHKLSSEGVVISSIPNMRYFRALGELLLKKDWKYKPSGVQDITHLRFFTKKSIYRMYKQAGYEVVQQVGLNPSKSIKPWLVNIPLFFSATDIRFLQFMTMGKKAK